MRKQLTIICLIAWVMSVLALGYVAYQGVMAFRCSLLVMILAMHGNMILMQQCQSKIKILKLCHDAKVGTKDSCPYAGSSQMKCRTSLKDPSTGGRLDLFGDGRLISLWINHEKCWLWLEPHGRRGVKRFGKFSHF